MVTILTKIYSSTLKYKLKAVFILFFRAKNKKSYQMITETTTNGLTFFQFNIGCYCFLAFTLSDLLKSIPKEYKNKVLTQLN